MGVRSPHPPFVGLELAIVLVRAEIVKRSFLRRLRS